jgi:RNA polymerase sigma-70 factor, ECF subfamily
MPPREEPPPPRSAPAPGVLAPASPAALSETELAQRFWARVRLFAARQLGDVSAAEDVAQETLRRVFEALREGRVADHGALPGFIFQTARHVCLRHHRSSGREARALLRLYDGDAGAEPSTSSDCLTALITEERRRAVRTALERLDHADRDLLRLAFYDLLDAEQIAQRLAVTSGAVRVRKHRALRRLAELLDGGATGDDCRSTAS